VGVVMSNNFDTEEIKQVTKAISLLINDCLGNFNEEQLLEVKSRHRLLIEQQVFWITQNNYNRFFRDLKEYANWLCDFVAEVENNS
jgi:hypothetical protein